MTLLWMRSERTVWQQQTASILFYVGEKNKHGNLVQRSSASPSIIETRSENDFFLLHTEFRCSIVSYAKDIGVATTGTVDSYRPCPRITGIILGFWVVSPCWDVRLVTVLRPGRSVQNPG